MAQPFATSLRLTGLSYPFPTSDELREALSNGNKREREAFIRQWLSEGVPFAFQECPGVYEEMRTWLGRRLDVHPKEVTLIGSGRIGYSLAGGKKFGRRFDGNSDLDLVVVSTSLFSLLTQTFHRFADDYERGRVVPKNDREAELWPENIKVCRSNAGRGFLDSSKVPNYDRYPVVQNVNSAAWYLTKRLAETPGAPNVQRASFRAYRCWRSFVRQVSFNLS